MRPIVLEKDVKGVSESQNDVEKQDFILISPTNDVLCQVSKPQHSVGLAAYQHDVALLLEQHDPVVV
jgi:hypothetical protein